MEGKITTSGTLTKKHAHGLLLVLNNIFRAEVVQLRARAFGVFFGAESTGEISIEMLNVLVLLTPCAMEQLQMPT